MPPSRPSLRPSRHAEAERLSVDVNGWTEAASILRIRILRSYERTPEVEGALKYEAWRLQAVKSGTAP